MAERNLVQAKTQITKLQSQVVKQEPTVEDRSRAAAAQIFADLKAGRPVDMDRVFAHFRPVLRDLSPLFDNMRRRDERREHARIATHMGEAYQLSPAKQEALKEWLAERSIQDAETFRQIVYSNNSTFADFVNASKYRKPEAGLDEFMERTLTGPTRDKFINDRLREKATRIESMANSRVDRLNDVVQLTPAQEDQVFAIMARSSPEYDARMKMDGLGTDVRKVPTGRDRETAIRGLLNQDQLARYNTWRQRRLDEANKEAAEIGLRLPSNWDLYEDW